MTTGDDLNDALVQIKMLAHMALNISDDTARAVLDELGRMHGVMPIFDPTAYRRDMGRIDESDKLVRAFIAFRDVAQRIADEEVKRI